MTTRMFPIGCGATLRQLEENPHPLLAQLRAAEPVSWLAVLGGWLVTRHDLAVWVMRDPTTFTVDNLRFSRSRVVAPSMLSLDGVEHARHREPFAHPLRPARVRDRFTEFIQAESDRLISAIEPAGHAEPRRELAGPLAVAVVAEALDLGDTATCDVELASARIQRGDLVSVSIAGVNRDPAVLADPNRFNIRRANVSLNFAFALGPHSCLGAELARVEAAMAVGRLLHRLPGLRLDRDQRTAPRGLVSRKPPTLHVRWTV